MDIISKIKEGLGHFSPSEEKVARLIIAQLNFAASASISELAEKAQVSHASITRLARTLGCENVRDLKFQLTQSAAIGERFNNPELVDKEKISHVYASIQEILALNAGLIEEHIVEQAGAAICATRHCLIFGVGGGSSMMAQECQNRFFRLDVLSNAYSDPMMMRMAAATVNKNDVVICLSLSGVSPDVMEAAHIAKEYGAQLVAICPDSELAHMADFHLPIKTQESDYIFKPSAARYAMMAAVDILSSEVAIRNQKRSKEKLRRLKIQLDQHRDKSANAPPADKRFPLGD
ncbi:MurR/RpiR family transcriptional regulator [Pseudoalteromonas sp. JBTF-M23]|uniref:MurR/RpiR family transcriptional regulator n=1 Tax=Pseudoalteromonas caenipelagi TaxID=2726988 RepID=A0A849VB88_9GAMM|nr:MurR/RpiR family transcriptional regulator [Pseudoalteromonas caenipelagi]NOU50889.1 MurR/RpiR family transcriptional regulator [Pseudoalteromonas caenipelagi]